MRSPTVIGGEIPSVYHIPRAEVVTFHRVKDGYSYAKKTCVKLYLASPCKKKRNPKRSELRRTAAAISHFERPAIPSTRGSGRRTSTHYGTVEWKGFALLQENRKS